jgi:hypothetical protein
MFERTAAELELAGLIKLNADSVTPPSPPLELIPEFPYWFRRFFLL